MIPCRKCPQCGNNDYDDDFIIMTCSECNFMYDAKNAVIVFESLRKEVK